MYRGCHALASAGHHSGDRVGAALVTQTGFSPAGASVLPTGFRDSVVLSGLSNPTVLQFAPDGRIFVGQKNGVIKVFQSLTDTNPVTVADLSSRVHDFWDRGLLGMALPPNFPTDPYVYVLYAYDAPIGGTPPTWGDACPTPPGPTTDGCLVSGRLSRLQISGNVMTGTEQVLINDWCQQFPSHSIGTLLFGRDGYLYVDWRRWRQLQQRRLRAVRRHLRRRPANPCGDPPGAVGTALSPPGAEGGALRSQSVRRTDGPATLDGAVLRIDPATGAGVPGNPFFSSPDANARRIVAYGLRNPFRMTQRPGTDELWIGDVGWNTWEEINRVVAPTSATASNFGWPCYEGASAQGGYQGAGLNLCSSLYSTPGSVIAPYYAYNHSACVVSYPGCRTGGSSITGVAFYQGGSYPATYNGALFFADHTRNEIWAMLAGTNGLPDPSRLQSFVGVDATGGAAGHPVDLKTGPGGDLFYVDMEGGTVHRITYTAANQPPTAVITASPTNGPVPLTVSFDGTGSSDPEGKPLSYSWDLNGDGTFGDATGSTASYTYTAAGVYHPSLRVTDDQGATDTASVTVTAGQHRTDRGHRLARVEPDLEGRRRDHLLRPRHRCAGRHAAGVGAELVADPASLLHANRLPYAPDPDHQRRRQRICHGSGPRIPVLARTAADRDRLGRADLDDERPAGPQDGRAHVQDQPGRSRPQRPGGQRGAAHHAVLRDRGRRLGELGQRPIATAVQQVHLLLHVVVGRRPAEPHHHRARGEHHLHRDLPQTLRRSPQREAVAVEARGSPEPCPQPSIGLGCPPEAKAGAPSSSGPLTRRGPADFPAQHNFGAGVRSAARYVPPSDARVVQEYRLAA